ncbi:hypothetical protein Ancab_023940 [Ancistrocladus abbreviatus]
MVAEEAESPEIHLRIVDVDNSPSSSAESSFRELDDAFLQTQTRIWLGEVLQTRFDEQMNVSDLLADGKLLYQVSEVIGKMLLTTCMDTDDIKVFEWKSVASSKSTRRYMPYFNVAAFLRICKVLGLDGIDLFTPSDVVEKRDTRKVCMCIRSLSKKARSRSLNVPDFDIVTYTLAMPTDMVECIRRSLELSQCSSSVSPSHHAEKDAKVGSWNWKRNSGAVHTGNSGYCSDGSVDSDGSMIVDSHRTSPTSSNGISPDSLMLRDYESAQAGFKSNMGDYERVELEDQYMPMSVAESVGSRCSQNDSDNELDIMQSLSWRGLHFNRQVMQKDSNSMHHESVAMNHIPFQLNWADSTSAVDSGDGNALEHSDLSNIGTDHYCTHSYTSFDKFNIDDALETGSDISPYSSHPALEIRYKSSPYDKLEDAESICSSLARGMNMDLHHSCVEEDFTASRVPLLALESSCHQGRSSMEDYETPGSIRRDTVMHRLSFDIDKPHSDVKLKDNSPSEKLLQPRVDWQSSPVKDMDSVRYGNDICMIPPYAEVVTDQGNSGCDGHSDGNAKHDKGLRLEQSTCTVHFEMCNGDCLCAVVGESNVVNERENSQELVLPELALTLTPCSGDALLSDNTNHAVKEDEEAVSCNSMVESYQSVEHSKVDIKTACVRTIEDKPDMMAVRESRKCQEQQNMFGQCVRVPDKVGEHKLAASPTDTLAEHVDLAVESEKHHQVCIDHENLQCGENINEHGVQHLKDNNDKGKPQHKAQRRLLKSVVGGTAVVGVLFLLLHIRKSRQEQAGKANRQIGRASDGNVTKNLPSQKRKEGVTTSSVYPAEKLRFGF